MNFTDLLVIVGGALVWLGIFAAIFSMLKRDPYFMWISYGVSTLGFWITFISQVLAGNHIWAIIFGIDALVGMYLWWKGRNNRKRGKALARLGAKSRAIINAMVEKLTPSPIPSPVRG